VFASAARAPLTSVARVVEMTGDFTLTLAVMLAVAIATSTSGGLSYGTIYTTKLLRHGTDIDRVPSRRRSPRRTGHPACPARRPPAIRLCRDRSPASATCRRCSPANPSPMPCASWN
jgi:Voltage gated chloride channel